MTFETETPDPDPTPQPPPAPGPPPAPEPGTPKPGARRRAARPRVVARADRIHPPETSVSLSPIGEHAEDLCHCSTPQQKIGEELRVAGEMGMTRS